MFSVIQYIILFSSSVSLWLFSVSLLLTNFSNPVIHPCFRISWECVEHYKSLLKFLAVPVNNPLCEKRLSLLYKLTLYQCIRGSALLYCSFSSYNGFSWSFHLLLPLWSCSSSNRVITQSLCKGSNLNFEE